MAKEFVPQFEEKAKGSLFVCEAVVVNADQPTFSDEVGITVFLCSHCSMTHMNLRFAGGPGIMFGFQPSDAEKLAHALIAPQPHEAE